MNGLIELYTIRENPIMFLPIVSATNSRFGINQAEASEHYFSESDNSILLQKSFTDSYIIEDMYVNCKYENDYFLCHDNITHMYGIGDTRNKAMDNYRLVILDFFEFLEENLSNLSSSDLDSYKYLKDYISKM
jgi:hypothetical protein